MKSDRTNMYNIAGSNPPTNVDSYIYYTKFVVVHKKKRQQI